MTTELSFVQTRDLVDFRTIIQELEGELGSRFPLSMASWCGIEQRPYPLPVWEVFLVAWKSQYPVGICSYYQQVSDSPDRFWLGWLGVLPMYRRHGIATRAVAEVERRVTKRGAKDLWVHTDEPNRGAIAFYLALGFTHCGRLEALGLPQASASSESIVLKKHVSVSSANS